MPKREKVTRYISVSQSPQELTHLKQLVEASGKTRNRFLRDLLAKQKPEPPKGQK